MSDQQQEKQLEQHVEETATTQDQPAIQMTDKQAMEHYLNDPEAKANHLKMAQQLQQLFAERWFTIDHVVAKSLLKDKKVIIQMMVGLQLFKLCIAKEDVNPKRQTRFKITIDPKDRLKVLEEYRETHVKQIELLDKDIEKLKQQIADNK
jgi:hypothetical protein